MDTDASENSTSGRWWLAIDGRPDGPRTTAYVTAALQAGRVTSLTPICPEGGCEWRPLATWPSFGSLPVTTPPPLPPTLLAGDSRSPAFGGERLLTNPALPPMANVICIYSIAVVPIYWLIGFASMFVGDNPFLDGTGCSTSYALFFVLHEIVTLATTIGLAFGGLRLRDLRSSGERLVRLMLSLSLVWVGVQWIVMLGLMILGASSESLNPETETSSFDALHIFLSTGAFAFDVVSLIWLVRHRARLPLNLRT